MTTTFGGNSPSITSPGRRRERTLLCEPSASTGVAAAFLPRFGSTAGVGRSGALKINEMPTGDFSSGLASGCFSFGSLAALGFLAGAFTSAFGLVVRLGLGFSTCS